MSASHIIQAGNDLFIGKNEAYIMNRKKEEKSVLRKGATCTSSTLFVKVPAGATAPADLMTKTQLGPNVTESMSVVADPATYGIELANCPRTAAALGRVGDSMATNDGSLQRFEQETVTSQNLANAIENMSRTRIDATGLRLRLQDGERLYPKSWSGTILLAGFAREITARRGYVDPKHEAGTLTQEITKGTLRATEAWTDGRHTADDKNDELEYELAVTLANVTEGAARCTVLKVNKVEPSHGFVAWQALVDGYVPKSSTTQL